MPLKTSEYNKIADQLSLGDYTGAAKALECRWAGPGTMPERDGHSEQEYAALVMLCGILTVEQGMFGGNLQEQGKDMLSLSVRLFGDYLTGVHIAQAWLGVAYERCGDLREALALADSLLSANADLEVTVSAAKTKSVALLGLGYPEKALETVNEISGVVSGASVLLQGKISLQRGLVLRKLGHLDEALENYDLATEKFHEAGSPRYEASAANNMGAVYMYRGEFLRAHVLTEKAIRLFREIGDQVHEGAAWDMSAQVSRKEGKLCEAEKSAHRAIALLEQTDRSDYLAEAYTTLGLILVELGAGAAEPFEKAAAIYAQTGNTLLLDAVLAQLWGWVTKVKHTAETAYTESFRAVRPLERQIFERVLEKHNWRRTPAAEELGISQQGFTGMLKKYYPDLLEKCGPLKPRRHSVITK